AIYRSTIKRGHWRCFQRLAKHCLSRKKDKVINQIKACHEGNLNDSRFGSRMRGTGVYAKLIKDVFDLHCKKNHLNTEKFEFNCSDLKRPHGKQLSLSF